MSQTHPIAESLLVLLENQVARTIAAFEGLDAATFDAPPGNDCHSIRQITAHLLGLRKFQLTLLSSPLAAQVPELPADAGPADVMPRLEAAAALVREALATHDPDDWLAVPATPRQGPWGELPTLARYARPYNDFTNHLGSIRAIRRIRGNPAQRSQ
jgi:hypothetical protein